MNSRSGKDRLSRLVRRRDYLRRLLDAGEATSSHDEAEESAIRWGIDKLHELRAKLDLIVQTVKAEGSPELAAKVALLSEENPPEGGISRPATSTTDGNR